MTDDAPRCATCKHWDHHRSMFARAVDVGACRRIADGPLREQPHVDLGGDAWWDPITRADFGCVLHEPVPHDPQDESTSR